MESSTEEEEEDMEEEEEEEPLDPRIQVGDRRCCSDAQIRRKHALMSPSNVRGMKIYWEKLAKKCVPRHREFFCSYYEGNTF